jgi:hypothetical protein
VELDPRLADSARALLSAAAVRDSANRMMTLGCEGALEDWRVDLGRLPLTADFVAKVVRDRYPRLDPPIHARWRHFVFDGRDLWAEIAKSHAWPDSKSRARAGFDLVLTSVLLDAGAGTAWRYRDAASGLTAARSEGLALASLRWFEAGGLSDDPRDPLRVDAAALCRVDAAAISAAFQVSETNPLLGADGRASLLNRLGEALYARADLFSSADTPRPGGLFDALAAQANALALPASHILTTVLEGLGCIWENRPSLGGVPLGDCWLHPALAGGPPAQGYVPLHKLSQWLTYSLLEPLESGGVAVCGLDALTGLAEYRNGGLFVDMGVLAPKISAALAHTYTVSDAFVVGWRALTVALLDRIAPLVRQRLGVDSAVFPLSKVLEGGTWAAGRLIAREKRTDGGPPIKILSDGTVF